MIRISQLHISIDEGIDELKAHVLHKLKINASDLVSMTIFKEAIDARKGHMQFSYIVDCEVKNEKKVLKKHIRDVILTPDYHYHVPKVGNVKLEHRPIIIGFGPAGMFAGLLLAQMGYKPLIFERGEKIDDRIKSVEKFWQEGILNEQSNVQFGEGGAGTFSDGKLTTRVKDPRVRKVLEEFVKFHAPDQILYEAHPHIGTDLLRNIVKEIREEIISLGGEVFFSSQVTSFDVVNDILKGIYVNERYIPCDACILAIGHSARDTMLQLIQQGFNVEAKAFAIGARIEHPQELIDRAQYKEYAFHPRLKKAEYRLTSTSSNGRGVYTFCMCPGGYVVASSSEKNGIVVNGMSEHKRDGKNANSALLVQISPDDYGNTPQKAIEFQRNIEKKAFIKAGSTYAAPIQRVEDFLNHRCSDHFGDVLPTYPLSTKFVDLHEILPDYVCTSLKEAMINLDQKLKGFAHPDALLTGVETRSSSPVRIIRQKDTLQSNIANLYPCGEGAGYAGGIVSAAIDGIRCAEAIIMQYKPFDEE